VGRERYALGLLALVVAGGCTGGTAADTKAAAQVPAPRPTGIARRAAVTTSGDSLGAIEDSAQRAREMDVLRETFAYQGGARDPFNSLISTTSTGPELVDLELVGIYLNERMPSSSVVVLREKTGQDKDQNKKRYKMRVGDRLGRIRLAQINDHNAVFMIQDLGFERQETLSLRKQEDATP
jgi:hypothetical protein